MAKCKSCGVEIIWIKSPSGKLIPCDPTPIPVRAVKEGEKDALKVVLETGVVASGIYDPDSEIVGHRKFHWLSCVEDEKNDDN